MTPLEALLAAFQPHAEPAAPPTPREVAEAAAYLGMLSDPDSRWFRPAVAAGGV